LRFAGSDHFQLSARGNVKRETQKQAIQCSWKKNVKLTLSQAKSLEIASTIMLLSNNWLAIITVR